MPVYVIEPSFAEALDGEGDAVRVTEAANADEGVRRPFSFQSAERRHSDYPYEAPSPDAIVAAARRAGIAADAMVEVNRVTADIFI